MGPEINLIPNSGIQFVTVPLDLAGIGRIRRHFWEEPAGTYEDGTERAILRPLLEGDDGRLREPVKGLLPREDETYQIGRKEVIETMRRQWVPLPFFRVTKVGSEERFAEGPANWVRGRLLEAPSGATGADSFFRLVIVFDTATLPAGREYNAPSIDDEQAQDVFAFADRPDETGWFMNKGWVGEWLKQILDEKRASERSGRRATSDANPHLCEHYAIYQTFLAMLGEAGTLPRVQLLQTTDGSFVDVDLVLDLGNARSCGILIEEHPGQGLNLTNSYPLKLRDLTQPELLYSEPFPSRVEFARANFGRERLSRQSGRAGAFSWASPVRTGIEAQRLAGARIGNEGLTGLSSPKRYLWDTRPSAQGWRFNSPPGEGLDVDPPANGPFRTMLSESKGLEGEDEAAASVAGAAVFSRSLLFTFMLTEIILQASMQMNAPQNRIEQHDATRPRRLRSVMLTMPPGMPVAEQKILRRRAGTAIELATVMRGLDKKDQPQLRAELDEATAIQIVWLHNEVTERLGGNVEAMFELYGRARSGSELTIRVASLDIGGGTTDLMVTTYGATSGGAFVPHQEFRESFKIAGDDVLEAVILNVVLPPIESAMARAGVRDAKATLNRSLVQDLGGQSVQDRHARRLFVSTVLEPAALEALHHYEKTVSRPQGEIARFRLGDVIRGDSDQVLRSTSYLIRQSTLAGASSIDLLGVEIAVNATTLEAVIAQTLRPVIDGLAEVIWHYDCDVLLLSGRPSRLQRVFDMIVAAMPLAPHKIVAMHQYRVGSQYPFRSALDLIEDPKTTVAVGAALCVRAEGRLQNFHLRVREFQMRSTARFIGELDLSSQLRDEKVRLHNVDLDGPPTEEVDCVISDFEGKTQIGFRQLPIERWPATPLYMLEFGPAAPVASLKKPFRITLRRADVRERDEERNDFSSREHFRIHEVVDAEGETRKVVQLRLQTLPDAEGYWRDTGRLGTL